MFNPLQIYQRFIDRTTPHLVARWTVNGVLLVLFILRVVTYQGFYVVAYALGIFLLNIFLLFLSPRFDPSLTGEDEDEDGGSAQASPLPTRADEEFRPFIRRLPEFKFWHNAVRALVLGLLCTLIPALDIPVFWPILLVYFIILTALTLRRQIKHMIKYHYVPFDIGKKAYNR